eukprot:scaffold293821_cov37-Prasinocladus_malaysianus.AAC.1
MRKASFASGNGRHGTSHNAKLRYIGPDSYKHGRHFDIMYMTDGNVNDGNIGAELPTMLCVTSRSASIVCRGSQVTVRPGQDFPISVGNRMTD